LVQRQLTPTARRELIPAPPLRTYRVTTTLGRITVNAYSVAHAIRTGLELLGGTLQSCLQEGDW